MTSSKCLLRLDLHQNPFALRTVKSTIGFHVFYLENFQLSEEDFRAFLSPVSQSDGGMRLKLGDEVFSLEGKDTD